MNIMLSISEETRNEIMRIKYELNSKNADEVLKKLIKHWREKNAKRKRNTRTTRTTKT